MGVRMPITENNWRWIVLFSLEEDKWGPKKLSAAATSWNKQPQKEVENDHFPQKNRFLWHGWGAQQSWRYMAGKHTTGTEPLWLHKTLCMTPSSKPLTSTPQEWVPVHFTSPASLTQPSAIIKTFAVKLIERQIKNKLRKMRCRMPTCTS